MAARKRTWTPQIVRDRIRTSMLIQRLEKQALAEDDVEMNALQQDAAKFLVSLVVAKAEAPREYNVNLTLSELIKRSISGS